ncbi:MAG: pstS [Acidimicrobiaceae bacterium]|nr:pstS [Acidimicrobiaceae bacterium]
MDAHVVSSQSASRRRLTAGRAALAALAGATALSAATAGFASASTTHSSATSTSSTEKTLATLEGKASGGTISETGSSLFYPLFSTWAQSYKGSSLQTASTGSGAGQSGAEAGTVNVGASDAYLPPSVLSQTGSSAVLDIPVVVSAQQIDYNIPGLAKGTHLHLSAHLLAAIYSGSVTMWNDPSITRINKGVSIPAVKIVPLHRSDSSGDTFLFSSYLAYQDPSSFVAKSSGPGTTVSFPNVSGALSAKGNSGMLTVCGRTPGCVAYIGISYLRSAVKQGLGYAALLNGSGNWVLPTPANVASEVASYKHIPASGAVSMVNSKTAKNGYPIVNFEYAIVKANQSSSSTAASIKALLAWGMDPKHGSAASFLAPVDFQALPSNALGVALKLVQSIH